MTTILHVFSSFAIGGAQIRFLQLVRGLGPGYRHLVIAMDGNTSAASRLPSGSPVDIVPLTYPKGKVLQSLWLFRRTLSRLRPDLLITYNWGAIEWGLVNLPLPVCPHVDIEDGFGPDEAAAPLPRRVMVRRLVYGRARAVVVPSRTLERMTRDLWRLDPAKIVYIPNGVDAVRFGGGADPAVLARFGLGTGEPLIGTVTALRPEKNLSRLISAFAEVARTRAGRLVIVGDGAERPALQKHAEALGVSERVVFTGALDRPETVLGAFTLYAISSDTEQMPISLAEAMAAGLPVASVDVGDIAAMVSAENRPYVQGRESVDLARSFACLLDDPSLAARLGHANRVEAQQRFSESAMIAAYDRLFQGGHV